MFTEEEALAVTLGLIAARRLGLGGAAPATEGALAKIERVLPLLVSERIRALEATIGFTQEAPQAMPAATGVLLTLSLAAQHQQRVRIGYRARDGAESERDVDSYGLVFHYGRWYLVGFDHSSTEIRTFRVDRVLTIAPQDERFRRPPEFDTVEHLRRALASMPFGFEVEVLLRATLDQVRTRVPAHVANLEETRDGTIMRTHTDDLAAAARYLAGIGFQFIVLRPSELRDEVHRLGVELLATARQAARAG
jgi:predicted DNA-binding transcriptional regulator YafY